MRNKKTKLLFLSIIGASSFFLQYAFAEPFPSWFTNTVTIINQTNQAVGYATLAVSDEEQECITGNCTGTVSANDQIQYNVEGSDLGSAYHFFASVRIDQVNTVHQGVWIECYLSKQPFIHVIEETYHLSLSNEYFTDGRPAHCDYTVTITDNTMNNY